MAHPRKPTPRPRLLARYHRVHRSRPRYTPHPHPPHSRTPASTLRAHALLPQSPKIAAEFLILSPDRQPQNWKRATLILPESLRHHEKITVSPLRRPIDSPGSVNPPTPCPTWPSTAFPPSSISNPRLRTSLFVSQPDGSQLVFLGRTRPGTTVPAVRWSPASDQLTFVYQNALWTQPLPQPAPPY
jgi:hypothetical protein